MAARWHGLLSLGLVTAILVSGSVAPALGATNDQPTPDPAGTVWLCRPGQSPDPCTAPLDTTVVEPDGARRTVDYRDAKDPGIDCFYVYPNITRQTTPNASLRVDPQQTAIAELEASPFSQVCRVFAPMYRENSGRATSPSGKVMAFQIAYDSVLSAWEDYLARYNDGRGVVLIGHSEGSSQLAQLLTSEIDQVPAVRKLLVSAIITGYDLPVYKVGFGPLKTIEPCTSESDIGCVIDFNAYSTTPPSDATFGKPLQAEVNGHAVEDVCTNPADLAGGSGTLRPMYRVRLATQDVAGSTTHGIFADRPPTASTPWIEYDGGYTATCVTSSGRRVLVVTSSRKVPPLVADSIPFGLHVDDPNLAMGNLVQIVHDESDEYLAAQHSPQGG